MEEFVEALNAYMALKFLMKDMDAFLAQKDLHADAEEYLALEAAKKRLRDAISVLHHELHD
jgi:hypothetical protein